MSGAQDISWFSLGYCLLLVVIPLAVSWYLRLKLSKEIIVSVIRMITQLFLVGIFLVYIFDLDNLWLTFAWLMMMVLFATHSVISKSKLCWRCFLFPTMLSFAVATVTVLLYFNGLVIRLDNIFEAKYIIALAGMLLGNSLRGNIIGVNSFYDRIRRNENRYLYRLSAGATKFEACLPYIRQGLKDAILPMTATVATMGIVALPGMMTGQILGGSSPMVAIKYQIAIMIAILAAMTISITMSLALTIRNNFDPYGRLRKEVFRDSKDR